MLLKSIILYDARYHALDRLEDKTRLGIIGQLMLLTRNCQEPIWASELQL